MNADPGNMPDPLSSLLRRADAAAPPPPARDGLADEVRRLSCRRQTRRRVGAAAFSVVAIASTVAILQSSRGRWAHVQTAKGPTSTETPPTTATVPSAAPAALVDYGRVKYEADARVASAYRFLAADQHRQRMGALNARLAELVPTQAERVTALRAAAAVALISQADRLNSRAGDPRDALATYRRAAELFPDTPWVAVARQRIEEVQSQMRKQETPL